MYQIVFKKAFFQFVFSISLIEKVGQRLLIQKVTICIILLSFAWMDQEPRLPLNLTANRHNDSVTVEHARLRGIYLGACVRKARETYLLIV